MDPRRRVTCRLLTLCNRHSPGAGPWPHLLSVPIEYKTASREVPSRHRPQATAMPRRLSPRDYTYYSIIPQVNIRKPSGTVTPVTQMTHMTQLFPSPAFPADCSQAKMSKIARQQKAVQNFGTVLENRPAVKVGAQSHRVALRHRVGRTCVKPPRVRGLKWLQKQLRRIFDRSL